MSQTTIDPRSLRAPPRRPLRLSWSDERVRAIVWQVLVVGAIGAVVWWLWSNTVHNLERNECIQAVREIQRITREGKAYIQVDSYRTPEERELFVDWVLTAYTHDYPEGWKRIFEEAGYTGDYYWTLINP